MANISALTSTANPSFAIGPNGATNPTLSADSSVGSAATGIKAVGRAAAAGASIVVSSSGTDEKLTIDAKGSGKVEIAGTSTGDVDLKRNTTVTGTLGVSGNVAVNTDKFAVTAANGNTAVGGTLGVTGDVAVNTNKFNVTAASGNTAVAGTLGVTGAATLGSTLGVTGNVAVNTNKFTVAAASGDTVIAGDATVGGSITIGATELTEANLIALLATLA